MDNIRRPEWLKVRLRSGRYSREVKDLLKSENLFTVCQSAHCPNIGDCWSKRTATFMILGNICTRNCQFCAVQSGNPIQLDSNEPMRVARAVKKLGLRHAVITSVTRDDLSDGGSRLFVETIQMIRNYSPNCSIEVLIPDFNGNRLALYDVFKAEPDILNHNLEVVSKLYPKARSRAKFNVSFNILKIAKKHQLVTKTGIMLGLGENLAEVEELIMRLSDINLDILTIGQYLQPSREHLKVEKYYHPDEFNALKEFGEQKGVKYVESGPLVRSSYHAVEQKNKLYHNQLSENID